MFLFFLAHFAVAFKFDLLADVEGFIHDKLVCLGLLRLVEVNAWMGTSNYFVSVGCQISSHYVSSEGSYSD